MMKKLILLIFMVHTFILSINSQPKVIAHRGFWKTEGSAQNSIASLVKADSIGCYGSEFDVWLTADNHLVVNHNTTHKGYRIEKSTLADLKKLKLSNGEEFPTLEEYFQKATQLPSLHLILELKPLSTPKRETMAIEKILDLVHTYQLERRIEYISFSLHSIKEFIRLAPSSPVYYLNGELSPIKLKEIGCTGMDYSLATIRRNPKWIQEAKELGLKINVWTVNKEKDMKFLLEQQVDFITTDYPILLQKISKE